jgi:hypothetical protein
MRVPKVNFQFQNSKKEEKSIQIQKIDKQKKIAISKNQNSTKSPNSNILSIITNHYNSQKKTENGRKIKFILLDILKTSNQSLTNLQMNFNLNISNTTWYKNEFSERKKNQKRKEKFEKKEEEILNFLKKNSTEAANRTIKIKKIETPCRYLLNSIPSLLLKYNLEIDSECSEYFFRKIIKKKKIYQIPKKESDKCSICDVGRKCERKLTKLNVCDNEKNDLQNSVETYLCHQKIHTNQYKEYKKKKSLEYLKANPNLALIVVDFKENIKLGKGPIELDKDFFNPPTRTVFGFVIYSYNQSNQKVQKLHYVVISEILNHDTDFVISAFQLLFKEDFIKKFQKFEFFSDCGPHFRNFQLVYFLLESLKFDSVNFFVEKHGKNSNDSFFSLLSKFKLNFEEFDTIDDSQTFIKHLEIKFGELKLKKQLDQKKISLTVPQLKKECTNLGLSINGTKPNLIERLRKNGFDFSISQGKNEKKLKFYETQFVLMDSIERIENFKTFKFKNLKTYYCFQKSNIKDSINAGVFSQKNLQNLPDVKIVNVQTKKGEIRKGFEPKSRQIKNFSLQKNNQSKKQEKIIFEQLKLNHQMEFQTKFGSLKKNEDFSILEDELCQIFSYGCVIEEKFENLKRKILHVEDNEKKKK